MILVGTCSWTEKTLIKSGEFYPRNIRTSQDRLRYYASHFPTVEIDSTYYAIPYKENAVLWSQRTPERFVFHVKVYAALTGHGIDPVTLPEDLRRTLPMPQIGQKYVYIKDPSLLNEIAGRFIDSLSPLASSNKLGLLVFQFPPWFHYKTANLDYILKCKELVGNLPIAVEFRHGSWLGSNSESVFKFLSDNNITYITADEPQYGSQATIPFIPYATTDIAYLRLHGRNRENWLKRGIDTPLRYKYLYSEEELRGFIPSIARLNSTARVTYVMFNNCYGGFAIRNAARMRELVEEIGKES